MAGGGKLSHIRRTVSLVQRLLAGETLDADAAAKVLGVKRPAADRQLKALAAVPGVVVERGSRPRRYNFDRFAFGGEPSFATAIAACFGASLAPLFAGTTYHPAMSAAREHVHRLTKRGAKFQHIDRKFVFVTGGGEAALPDKGGELDDLIQALIEQTCVKLVYRRFSGEVVRRRVEPLSLVVYNHQLYLIARGPDGVLHHPYRFARIEAVDDEKTCFDYPTRNEYDPEQFFAHSFGIFAGGVDPLRWTPDEREIRCRPWIMARG